MRMLRLAPLIAVFLALPLHAQTAPQIGPPPSVAFATPTTQRAADRLRALMAKHRIPGLSIAVGQRDRVLWSEAFGVSDLETRAPVTTDSIFPLGSTTKILPKIGASRVTSRL